MGSLTVSNKILNKYFSYLKHLDNNAKKLLITKLTNSLKKKPDVVLNSKDMFGAWEDDRSSDEIISEIKAARVNKPDSKSFE